MYEIEAFGLQLKQRSVRLNFKCLWSNSSCKWSERKKVDDVLSEKREKLGKRNWKSVRAPYWSL